MLPDREDILVTYMSSILAKMKRDAIRTAGLRLFRQPERFWMSAAARVAHGRNMVNVDPKTNIHRQLAPDIVR